MDNSEDLVGYFDENTNGETETNDAQIELENKFLSLEEHLEKDQLLESL